MNFTQVSSERKENMKLFLEKEMPKESEESWRYTYINNFDINKFSSSEAIINMKGNHISELKDSLENEEVKKILGRKKEDADKFDLLNETFWTNGYVVNVPDNTDAGIIEVEIHSGITRNIIIIGKNSKAEVIEHIKDGSGLNSNFLEVHTKQNSKVKITSIHNVSSEVNEFSYKRAFPGKDSEVLWVVGQFGGLLSRIKVDNHFMEEGASSLVTGLFAGSDEQHLDLTTNAFHKAANTTNNIFVKGALRGKSSQVYRGLIHINKNASQTVSNLTDHAIMLSEDATANSIPSLKIDNDDVKCTHSASVGQVDEDKIIYLMSRGLSHKDAESLIVEGFYMPLINSLPAEKEKFMEIIKKKVL
jgi:Fe-S cluster assembly protein SufD